MSGRRRSAAIVFGALLALLLAEQPLSEVRRRILVVTRFAPRELAVRRLGGSSAAFDRRYFAFLENARRRVPAGVAGVAVAGAPAADPYVYLAMYDFAPLPVRFGAANAASGWWLATYGPGPSGLAPVRARFAYGFLEGPLP